MPETETVFAVYDVAGQSHAIHAHRCVLTSDGLRFELNGQVLALFFLKNVTGVNCLVAEEGRFVNGSDADEEEEEQEE
jgi:hypothetical protein